MTHIIQDIGLGFSSPRPRARIDHYHSPVHLEASCSDERPDIGTGHSTVPRDGTTTITPARSRGQQKKGKNKARLDKTLKIPVTLYT